MSKKKKNVPLDSERMESQPSVGEASEDETPVEEASAGVTYTLDPKVYNQAVKMLDKHSGAYRRRDLILCFLAVFFTESFWGWMMAKGDYERLASAGLMLAVGIIVFFIPIIANRRDMKTLMASSSTLTLTVTRKGLVSRCGDYHGGLNFDIDTVLLEDKKMIYIEQKKGQRYYILKEQCDEKQVDAMLAIMKSRGTVKYTYIEGSNKNRRG